VPAPSRRLRRLVGPWQVLATFGFAAGCAELLGIFAYAIATGFIVATLAIAVADRSAR
jgi:hypothetical protein